MNWLRLFVDTHNREILKRLSEDSQSPNNRWYQVRLLGVEWIYYNLFKDNGA